MMAFYIINIVLLIQDYNKYNYKKVGVGVKRKKHKSLNNPLRACADKVTYDYRIAPVNININQDVLCTYIEHGADCLEIYVLFTKML